MVYEDITEPTWKSMAKRMAVQTVDVFAPDETTHITLHVELACLKELTWELYQ